MSEEPRVVISTGPRAGMVLEGRRARRYLDDPEYRRFYDTTPAPPPATPSSLASIREAQGAPAPIPGSVVANALAVVAQAMGADTADPTVLAPGLVRPPGMPAQQTPPQPAKPIPRGTPTPPGFLQKAANLFRDSIRHVGDKARKVPQEVYEQRLAVCRECSLYVDNHCQHPRCGCQMASESRMTGALWWASKQCPDSPPRWLAWTEEDQRAFEEAQASRARTTPLPTIDDPQTSTEEGREP